MTAKQRNSKYFVVGGPVEPGRDCYIVRDADARIYTRLLEDDYCHVLASAHMGKTSLMAHTAKRLRDDGVRVATVDLAQISGRDSADDVGRWYYSIAYRIIRELRIRSDMQMWWQERSGLTNMQRLREFFLEVVLENTEERVVIFIDRIDAVVGRPFARDLLAAVRACSDSRAMEPEYQRLSFVMLGSAGAGQLSPGGHDSPFDISTEIELKDFDPAELRQLVGGLGCDQVTAARLSERIWSWTKGQPYLSQKILRGLARRADQQLSESTVDDVASALFLSRDGPSDEPHLMAVGKQVLRESPGRVARLSLYGRVRKGAKIAADLKLDIHRDLYQSGIVVIDANGRFAVRNGVYEQAFTAQWVNQNLPFGWKGLATAALAAVMLLGIPLWYSQYLPRPYVEVLTAANQDYVTALDAYKRLHFLPGFGNTADQLFADYLVKQSRRSRQLAGAVRINERLAEIPGQEALGESLLAEFWDRRAVASMTRGDRDAALLYAARAVASPTPARRQLVAELLGSDYGKLRGTIRTPVPLTAIEVDGASGLITTLDEQHRVEVWHSVDGLPRRIQTIDLLAEEIIPLQRRLVFQGEAGGFRLALTIKTDHPRPTDVLVELRAPSGRSVQLALGPESAAAGDGEFRFDSKTNNALQALMEENMNGTWSAYFTDALQGVSGSLLDWEIQVDGKLAQHPGGVTIDPMPIPESGFTRQASSALAAGGQRVLTWPRDASIRGDILVWNISGGEVIARIPRNAKTVDVRFAYGQNRVLVSTANALELWDVERAEMLNSISIEPSLVPVLSDNGRFMVVDSVLDDLENVLAVWDLNSFVEVGRLVTGTLAELVATDSTGQLLAVSDGDRLVRVWSVRDGELVAEYQHGAKPTSVKFDSTGRWLATQDAAHSFRLWSLEGGGSAVITRPASSAWSVSISENALLLGSLDRGFEIIGLPGGELIGEGFRHGVPVARNVADKFVAPAWLAAEQGFAVTYDGEEAVKVWQLPQTGMAEETGALRTTEVGNHAAISRDGRQLAIATNAGDVRILPIDQNALLMPGTADDLGFIGHLGPVTDIVFDATGSLVASGSFDGTVRVWETATGAPRPFFASHADDAVHDLVFSPDGDQVISASRKSVIVTDSVSGEMLAQTVIQGEDPRLAISDNGQHIYIADDRGGLTRWIWRGDISESLIEPESGIRHVAVNSDESIFVTADRNRKIQAWDTATVTPRAQPVRAAANVDFLWLDSGGTHVVVQAGVWLYGMEISPVGLRNQVTRLLEGAPATVYPANLGAVAYVLSGPHTSRPKLRRIVLAEPWPEPLNESLEQIIPDIESRLRLTISDWGEPQPLQQY
jgi:WD40 repeat protein